ncbi:MAG: 3-phosphoglycerate dehydrogenase [bacterium]|nr:3-phosphoglycerate dehydrogenase [bacterium]
MMKINCLNKISKVGLATLTKDYGITEDINEADAILVRSAVMHEMELPKGVLAVARAGAGVNNIPLDKFAEKGVVVFNTPGANANGVKEIVIAALLLASRDIIGGANWVKENAADENIAKTAEKAKSQFAGTEIKGKTISVIGLGAIGVLVANACYNLGMSVIGYDPYLSQANALNLDRHVSYTADLEEAVSKADFITIHVPAMDATKKMINKDLINKMKENAILLNFSRDVIVDEEALKEALQNNKIRKYVSDFANPLSVTLPNAIILPHLGASTEESEDNCAVMACEEIMDYIENGNIRNSVNYPACDGGICKTAGRISVIHKNVAGLINKLSDVFAQKNINICNMVSKSKGDYAYMLLDIDAPTEEKFANELASINGVVRVRIIK